jgi:hypothetical protein
MNQPSDTPPDGDFVRYVQSLEKAPVTAGGTVGITEGRSPAANPAPPLPGMAPKPMDLTPEARRAANVASTAMLKQMGMLLLGVVVTVAGALLLAASMVSEANDELLGLGIFVGIVGIVLTRGAKRGLRKLGEAAQKPTVLPQARHTPPGTGL